MDVLSDVLRAVRFTGALFFDMRFQDPFVGESPPTEAIARSVMPEAEHVISYHVLLSGTCYAEVVDSAIPPAHLESGDVVIFPHGDGNVLASSPGLRDKPDLANYYRPLHRQLPFVPFDIPPEEGQNRFVCGYFGCDAHPFNPLLDALPRMMHARADGDSRWLTELIRHAVGESENSRSGGETVLAKVSELMFVKVVRDYIDTLPEDSRGWLYGLRDRHVGAALHLMHSRPRDNWTLESLAHEAGVSRSVLAERFTHCVGVSPMQYLSRWRMQLAARLLDRPDVSLAKVAADSGYESEAAFSRAFKKHVGVPPGAWRRGMTNGVRGNERVEIGD